ncbi:MAG: acyltransferase [Verrucomicrobiales bacterium]|nr:acyltransferase [Verrucomicrobiales bacterium]
MHGVLRLAKCFDKARLKLARVSSVGVFIPEIDGLRFLAIASVVLFHLNGYILAKIPQVKVDDPVSVVLVEVFKQGGVGVQVFFAISGFILALPFAKFHFEQGPRVSLSRYFLRRLTRLEPPYLVNLILCFSLLVMFRGESFDQLLPHFAASALYVHNIWFGDGSLINYPAWSLEIEVQFYILLPLVAGLFSIRNNSVRRMIVLGIIGVSIVAQEWKLVSELSVFQYIQFFLLGFVMADAYLMNWKSCPKKSYLWDCVSLMAWMGIILVQVHDVMKPVLLPLFVLLAFSGAFLGVYTNRLLCNRWVVTVGGMCYTIYLYHYLILSFVGRWFITHLQGWPYWLCWLAMAPLILSVVFVSSSILFLFLEKPFMHRDWYIKLWGWISQVRSNEKGI